MRCKTSRNQTFQVPKSKQGLLAIKPAHEEVEEARSREDELKLAKAIAAWKKAGGKVKKLPPGRKFQSLFGKGYKPKKQPRQAEEVVREASSYRDRKYEKKKKGFTPQSQKKSRWGSGGYGKGEEVEVDEKKSAYWLRTLSQRLFHLQCNTHTNSQNQKVIL